MPNREFQVGKFGKSVARILELRVKASPLDNTTIAARAGMSVSSLRRIVTAARPVNADQLDLLASILKATPTEIFAEAEAATQDRPRDLRTYPNTDDILEGSF